MGELCLEHELRDATWARGRIRVLVPRLATATALVAAAAAGALIGTRLPR